VLRGEPNWAALPATTPVGIRAVLRRCLEKDRKKRLRDIGDVAILIDDLGAPVAADVALPVGSVEAPRTGGVGTAHRHPACDRHRARGVTFPAAGRCDAERTILRFAA